MRQLWREKTTFKQLGDYWRTITDILPYERLYTTLTQEELLQLIQDAKRLHWQVLDLHKCGLDQLPEELGELTGLRFLDAGNGFWRSDNIKYSAKNTFRRVPKSIGNLSQLQHLWLEDIGITTLPESFGCLSKLLMLNLGDTDITTLPESFGNLSQLQNLRLESTGIKTLPEYFGNLSQLQILNLRSTGITTLPESFGNLSQLHFLDLDSTGITALPKNFGNLSKLEKLILSHTYITTLPENFGNLSQLQYLDLERADITTIPESFEKLSKLQSLDLQGTPLYEKLPPEIQLQVRWSSDEKTQYAIRYILDMQSQAPKRYFNEAKMVVVGQGSVGKSSLINRLIHRKYQDQHSTDGIDIETWNFTGAETGLEKKEIYRLNVWDLGGQEIYHATHQFFLTRRTLYVLMWDALTEDDYGRRDYWMRTICSFAGESPVVIVVNKCDQDSRRIHEVEYAFLDKYPQIQNRNHVFYISCKDNVGINELRRYLLTQAVEMPLMKTEWLERWLDVRKDLETLSEQKNTIGYDTYREICERHDVQDERESTMLAQYFHDLGVIIHYHEDELLCNLVILSPKWGTDAVYKVLNEQQIPLKGRNGILYYDDLKNIWTDRKRYPVRMYPFLLRLMEKFQLAFPVDNPNLPKNTYLVAELLSKNPIPHDWTDVGMEPLAFRYQYDFLPAGVMTRLIVSIHKYLEDVDGVKQCWRKGAYLIHGCAHAKLVLCDGIDEKYLDIRIIGESARDRIELLTIAREHIQRIHSRFQKIHITELIPCKCSPGCTNFWKYQQIRKGEEKGRTEVVCTNTWENVSLKKLLDGVEMKCEKKQSGEYSGVTIHANGGNVIVGNVQDVGGMSTNNNADTAGVTGSNASSEAGEVET